MTSIYKFILSIVVVCFIVLPSCKPKEDPAPSTTNNTTNQLPTISSSYNSGTITTTVNDSDGSISKVEIYNGTTLLTTLTSSPYTYSVGTLSAGSYTYTVKVTDNSGGTASTTLSFTITSGGNTNQLPTISASYNSGTITATATDSDGSISKVEIFDGTTLLTTLTSSPYTYSVGTLSAGSYTYTVKVTDNSGGTATTTVSFTITQPNGAPSFTSTTVTTNGTGVVDITSMVTDPENDNITITTATSTGATISGISGKTFKVTSTTSTVTVSVTISDGTNSVTSNLTVTVPSNAITYGIMSNFFGTFTSSNPSGLIFSSNGNVVTGVSNSNFWGTGTCKSGTWTINTNGTLTISSGCGISTFDVTSSGNYLYLNNTYSYGTGTPFGGVK